VLLSTFVWAFILDARFYLLPKKFKVLERAQFVFFHLILSELFMPSLLAWTSLHLLISYKFILIITDFKRFHVDKTLLIYLRIVRVFIFLVQFFFAEIKSEVTRALLLSLSDKYTWLFIMLFNILKYLEILILLKYILGFLKHITLL